MKSKTCEYPNCDNVFGKGQLWHYSVTCICAKFIKDICHVHVDVCAFICPNCFIYAKSNTSYDYINHITYNYFGGGGAIIFQISPYMHISYFAPKWYSHRYQASYLLIGTQIKNANDLKQYTYSPLLMGMYTFSNNYVNALPKDIISIIDKFLFNERMFQLDDN